jgi:hypothetical protein
MIRRALIVLSAVATLACAGRQLAAGQDGTVRSMPYPFHHLFTIASDVDEQAAWHGAAIYRVVNHDIGLPMAGSVWVNSVVLDPPQPTFFAGDLGLNRSPSGANALPTFALLLRQWHRGETDQFHSWHNDSVRGLHNVMKPPVRLATAHVAMAVEPGPPVIRSSAYSHLRILFDHAPPSDLTIVAIDDLGHKAVADIFAVQRGHAVQYKAVAPFWLEVIFNPDSASRLRGIQIDPGFQLGGLTKIELIAPSCASGCAASILRVERDAFSRMTVLNQLPWLQAWNIRPSIYTAHGGFTLTQTLWLPDEPTYAYPDPTLGADPIVATELRGLLDQPTSFAYTADLLHQLGVDHIWPYSNTRDHRWNQPRGPLQRTTAGAYLLSRVVNPIVPTDSFEAYSIALAKIAPTLPKTVIADSYCSNTCGGDQGAMIGQLIGLALDYADRGGQLDHIYYTHLASGDDDWLRTAREPLKPSAVDMLKVLANRSYNFDGAIREKARIWVPPASTAARYRVLIENIAAHIKVEGDDIAIYPWKDAVTGRTIPDLAAGTRDLNGLTLYVPDPEKVKVRVGDTPIETFTRNPPDQTGRGSITIVDDHVPTTIIGSLPLVRLGPVATSRVAFDDAPWPVPGIEAAPASIRLQLRENGEGWVSVRPRNLVLYNTTGLKLRYRHTGKGSGNLFVELVLDDGSRIALSEGVGSEPPRDAGSGWWIPPAHKDAIVTRTLATTGMIFSSDKTRHSPNLHRPPLPLGRIAALRIGLKDAAQGEGLDLFELSALRSSGDAVAPDRTLMLAGRVTRDGFPLPGVVVTAVSAAGAAERTVSDADGLYFFTGLTAGDPVYVAADEGHRRCVPRASPIVDMRRNEAELDIDMADCREPPAAMIAGAGLTP